MFKLICYETCYDSQCVIDYILKNENFIRPYLRVNLKTALCAIYMFAIFFFSWVLIIIFKK